MRTHILLTATLGTLLLAGCFGGPAEEPTAPGAPEPPATPTKTSEPEPEQDDEPEPFQDTQVINATMHFDVQQAPTVTFTVPAGGTTLAGNLEVLPRELCSTLQANQDGKGPGVVLTAPDGNEHTYNLTPRTAACGTDGQVLEEKVIDVTAEPGDWTVAILGVGNVDVRVDLTATG